VARRKNLTCGERAGGGPNGQAGAVRHGISRALMKFDANLRPALKAEGLLTRDPHARERKKYGQPGARKRFQFSEALIALEFSNPAGSIRRGFLF
jgi:hypothetical protein